MLRVCGGGGGAVDSDASWLAALPAGGAALLWGAALAIAAALLRRALAHTRRGVAAIAALHACESAFLAALLAAMLVLSFVQILLRNVLHTGWVWVDPLLRHLLLWIGFVGAMLATRMEQHIHVDAVARMLPAGARRGVHTATSLTAAAICLLLAEACRGFMRDEAAAGTRGVFGLPVWCLVGVMPVALWIMCTRFVRHALDALTRAPGRGRSSGEAAA